VEKNPGQMTLSLQTRQHKEYCDSNGLLAADNPYVLNHSPETL
jgi:hypothetical protein